MILSVKAFFLTAMMIATIAAGSTARSADGVAPRSAIAVEDRALTIVIRPAVNLEQQAATEASSDLTLAEIVDAATIPPADRAAVMAHLKAVALTDRPKMGEERTFTQEGLETIVSEASRRLEAAGYTIEWKIPRRSHILRKNVFNRESVSILLQKEFAEKCGGCEVILRRVDLPVVSMLNIQSWRLLMRGEKPRGSFAVPVEFELAGDLKKTLMISGQAEFFAQVPTATRAIQGSEKITAADFKIERKDITYALDAPVDAKEFEGAVAARGLGIGEPIWKSSIRREQLVRFGDPVRVQAGGESWSVTTEGIAQGPAALGETVRVKVGKTMKLVSGILKEKGLVEIQ